MDMYEIGHINTTAENTIDKILKHKRIQHVNRYRDMDLQKLKNLRTTWIQKLAFYDWVGGVVLLGL